MTWWYEIRDANGQLVEAKRGFPSQAAAQNEGAVARRMILEITPDQVLKVVTGEDIWRPE